MDVEAEDFLEEYYGDHEGWIDLPAKTTGGREQNWIPYYHLWDGTSDGAISRRIDAAIRDSENLYFSCAQFSERGRDERAFKPSWWLWADLDEVHPSAAMKLGLTPTMAWQSSKGRYQALWKLDRRVGSRDHDKLNQALSYALGADKGGWDLTQVLRVPGTLNFKYSGAPIIRLEHYTPEVKYDPKAVWRTVRKWAVPLADLPMGGQGGRVGVRKKMPGEVRAMLRVPPDRAVTGERSDVRWKIEKELVKADWGEDEIYDVLRKSAWDSWATIRTGERRLRDEIRKAVRVVWEERRPKDAPPQGGTDTAPTADTTSEESAWELGDVPYGTFMAQTSKPPRWMIEGIWTDKAHGIIGGEAKTLKTTLALAMGMSVASGKAFLGEFPVHSPGPVLMIQEENTEGNIRDLMHKIASSYGLISKDEVTILPSPTGSIGSTIADVRFPDEIPFRIVNQRRVDLERDECRRAIEERVQDLRPTMVILDPMKEMFGRADLDKEVELRPYLKWLRDLRFEYDTAIVLVHHMRKAQANRSGLRIAGSYAFHGWSASALYFEDATPKRHNGWKRIKVDREFREQAPQDGLKFLLRMGPPGSLDFDAHVSGFDRGGRVADMVVEAGGTISMAELVSALEADRRTVRSWAIGEGLEIVEGVGRGSKTMVMMGENGDSPS